VSTTLGAEGLPAIDGKHLLIADSASDFASAIIRLLHDRQLASSLAANCRDLVEQNYSIDSLARQARAILHCLEEK
jgi:glycosyltransferase involved in cell wall biosynthesis